jgi:geranylgeranyl pyrophosphate synthase
MRPLLTLMVYSAYSKTFDQQIANQLMLMVECFHKASLIHDDIEDQDDYRYNKKTTHNENGIPLAINLGDYLIGQGYMKLSRLQVEPDIKLKLFDLFSTMHVESTIGQGEELAILENKTIANINSTLTIFRQKTGSAIQVSLLAGAIAANATETEQQLLKEFSDLFGIAYQIRDDLTEFRGTATDQQEASYPYLKSILFEKCKVNTTSQQQLKELITELEIDKTAQTELDATLSNLKVCLNKLESQKLRLALLNSVNRIFEL